MKSKDTWIQLGDLNLANYSKIVNPIWSMKNEEGEE